MEKQQLLETIQEVYGLENIKEAEKFVKSFNTLIEKVKDGLEKDTKIKLGKYLEISNTLVKGREGVSKIGGVEKPWRTEDHYEIKAKISKSLNK